MAIDLNDININDDNSRTGTCIDININDLIFESYFPLHCDIYARLETEPTLTMADGNVKAVARNWKLDGTIDLNDININDLIFEFGMWIDINDCDSGFKSCFPLHCDIYARVEKEPTLTMANGNVKVVIRNDSLRISIDLNDININDDNSRTRNRIDINGSHFLIETYFWKEVDVYA